jgi:hypothetical protein
MTTLPNRILAIVRPQKFSTYTFLFFLIYLIIGAIIVPDYGISTDETNQDKKAQYTIDYVLGRNDNLLTYDDRHYGAVLGIVFKLAGRFSDDFRVDYLARHYITFLIFYISTIIFHRLLRRMGYNQAFALLGTAVLILHPHIFAHSFYNPKDLPFLSIVIVYLYTLYLFIQQRTYKLAMLHGFVSGLLVVFRIAGVMMWAVTFLIWLSSFIGQSRMRTKTIGLGLAYLILALATVYVLLPAFWLHPISEARIFLSMQLFTWPNKELFMGQYLYASELPWIHIPVYMLVTTPLLYILLFAIGSIVILFDLFRGRLFTLTASHKFMALLAFYVPLASILILDPVVYNGWRHAFFMYPAAVVLIVEGLRRLWYLDLPLLGNWSAKGARFLAAVLVGYQLISVVAFMVDSHPYEHVYYNRLAGKTLADAAMQYNMDYWGLTYIGALKNLLLIVDSPTIRVNASSEGRLLDNYRFLKAEDRERFKILRSSEPADYFITNFRRSRDMDRDRRAMISSISVRGAIINATYKYDQ